MSAPTVAVVGAGAVGCYFGGMLARSGVPVTLIGRDPHMQTIAREGLQLNGVRVRERIPIAATTSLADGLGGAGIALLCVKTVHTETAAREIEPLLDPQTAVLSFQNGVDNVDRIFAATGRRALPVVVYVAAEMTAPGEVTHNARGDLVIGHRRDWPASPALQPLAALFERAEIPCRVSPAIETELWTKMALNCAYNAVSALTRATYGRIAAFMPIRAVLGRALAEIVAVAGAQGVTLSHAALMEAGIRLGEAAVRATSSTEQDIARGRPTEIDSLNGYIARRGAALGIPTPVNETLWALVKLREDLQR